MLNLKQNLPIWERTFRLLTSIIIGLVANNFVYSIIWQIMIFIIASILAFIALIGFCPLQAIFSSVLQKANNNESKY